MVACTWCGTTAEDAPATWTASTGRRGVEWMCERCTRDNVRGIDAQIDAEWW